MHNKTVDVCVSAVKVRESRARARSSSRCESFTVPAIQTTTAAVSSNSSIRTSSWQWTPWFVPWTLYASHTEIRPTRSALQSSRFCSVSET